MRRLLVAIAGPTGVIYGIRLLERLRDVPDLTRHLVLTEPARRAITTETEYAVAEVHELADHVPDAAAASLTPADGMVIAPCDVAIAAAVDADIGTAAAPGTAKTSAPDIGSAVAAGPGHNLILRAAAEILAHGRPLIVLVHQSPLGVDHLRCLLRLTERGAVILPPVPAFYNRPQGIEDIVLHTVARVIDRLGLPQSFAPEWRGSQLRT